jgi:hypothetical protein
LVVGDYFIGQFSKYLNKSVNTEAKKLMKDIKEKEGKREIAAARAQGYRIYIFPLLFESGKFLEIAERYQIAPLAPQPNTRLYMDSNEGYGLFRYRSDRFDQKHDDLWNDKNVDAVLIGDSFTQGCNVEEKNSIAGYLRAEGTANKVLNLGTAGNAPIHYASVAKIFLPTISTKNVVVIFYANDNVDDEGSVFNKLYFKNSTQYCERIDGKGVALSINLLNLYAEAEAEVARIEKRGFHERDNLFVRGVRYLTLPNIRIVCRNYLKTKIALLPYSSKLAIDTVISECEKSGCKSIFVYIPNSEYWMPDARSEKYSQALKSYVASDKKGIFVDTTEEIRQKGRDAYAIAGHHLSPLGYQIVAKRIIDEIKK